MNNALRLLFNHDDSYLDFHDYFLLKDKIISLIDNDQLTIHFQPIYSSNDGTVYAYEALTRINNNKFFKSIPDLFKSAIQCNFISHLDVICRANALKHSALQGLKQTNAYICINICPETLMNPDHLVGLTDELAEEHGISKNKIILEITEESAINDMELFKTTIKRYRNRGYKIAIDDFGAGYGGLKMLSLIEPELVKIDCHFIANIDQVPIKYNLVDAIATACHRMGIKIVAEGIEREEELTIILDMGIELLQGFYLGRPSPQLKTSPVSLPLRLATGTNDPSLNLEQNFMGEIAQRIEPILPSESVIRAFHRFTSQPELRGLPVVEDDRVRGMLHRQRFLENQMLGRYGYGFALNDRKKVEHLMERKFLMVEANATIQNVAQMIQIRKNNFLYDDICVTKNGKYVGTVSVLSILDALTEKSILLARGANPLSGLPGNEFIQREIEQRLSQKVHFDICYLDLDNFKPFNDHYGFERGDVVIKGVAQILRDYVETEKDDFNFVGHIGGDDFIMILRPQISVSVCETIIQNFAAQLHLWHGTNDHQKGFYVAKNRRGNEENYNLLSISIGIVCTEDINARSYGQIASIATEVKKAAKLQEGSAIIKNKRLAV
ncbi:MAG: bifunctional diguanylate cyclase/phosphodiesterase [Desulfobaccales bacterium]